MILAGISIQALTNTGLFGKAKEAKYETENARNEEEQTLSEYEWEINKATENLTVADAQSNDMLTKTENTTVKDEYGNKIVVPAGFKITTDATTVNKGIVIEDSAGNQFVWIPVGTIYTNVEKTESKTIELNRYTFDDDGTPTAQNDAVIYSNYQELETSTYGNTTAKDINAFKTSATTNGGYYIGRYEARTEKARSSSSDTLTTITENGKQYVYNYVTQLQAVELARNMYDNTKSFTSDLMNSYAWDTATLFLQKCGNNSAYSIQSSVNSGSLATTGTNNQTTQDIQCNVYDMASNLYEWTTETYNSSSSPCTFRGFFGSYSCTSGRYYNSNSGSYTISYEKISFRPILYI